MSSESLKQAPWGLVRYEFIKKPGPGGQHKNKRFTAVRATDTVTGVTAIGAGERSQSQNKVVAFERLRSKIARLKHKKKARVGTKKTRGARERTLEWKKKHGQKKNMRSWKASQEGIG